ncbi:MAG: TIGR03364 family FAD-dependent oxidoreductase [Planctomycetes bacterium]|nr:TIGR03364 family FAD-dependent oxidoreductase [Planctomycetota bacterium]
MSAEFDVGVVGAGIVGLAHAYHLARRGMRVLVLERHRRTQGASVRNFGMIWPIGQPSGPRFQLARRSRELWLEVLRASGLWHRESGSLHVVYNEDEEQVLREFVADAGAERGCELLTPAQIAARFPAVVQTGLLAGLWSPLELAVDPRQVIAELPAWLSKTFGVEFAFGTPVLGHSVPRVTTPDGERTVKRLVICTGADFRELAPVEFANSGLVPCKLQMMRSQAFGDRFQLGTHLAAGLTLRHYTSFAHCPTLPALARRLDAEFPEYGRFGIHVLVSQNGHGELTIGDSHEYGDAIELFDKPQIDELILNYLKTFLHVPDLTIAARWHGIYVKHPTAPYVVAHPDANTLVVTGVGGAGMTLSFGLAEQLLTQW